MRFDELGKRIKENYEYQTTQRYLMKGLPVYCRIDMRAGHTFCRGLAKPWSLEYVETMQEVTKFLVEETHAQLGYVQSDEISLCWLDIDKAPFDGKLFKLQSVLASLATSKFVTHIMSAYETLSQFNQFDYRDIEETTKHLDSFMNENIERMENYRLLKLKCQKIIPSFDCRVFQLPNEKELANTFVWREIDAVRNSVSMLAQANFSHKELQGKDRKAMITMLEEKGIRWNELEDDLKRGAYFKRKLVQRKIDPITWAKIPDNVKPDNRIVTRSEVAQFFLPEMKNVYNKPGVYFHNENPIFKINIRVNDEIFTCPKCNRQHIINWKAVNASLFELTCTCGQKINCIRKDK